MLKFGASDEVSTIKSSMVQAKHSHKICFDAIKIEEKSRKNEIFDEHAGRRFKYFPCDAGDVMNI